MGAERYWSTRGGGLGCTTLSQMVVPRLEQNSEANEVMITDDSELVSGRGT